MSDDNDEKIDIDKIISKEFPPVKKQTGNAEIDHQDFMQAYADFENFRSTVDDVQHNNIDFSNLAKDVDKFKGSKIGDVYDKITAPPTGKRMQRIGNQYQNDNEMNGGPFKGTDITAFGNGNLMGNADFGNQF